MNNEAVKVESATVFTPDRKKKFVLQNVMQYRLVRAGKVGAEVHNE